MATQEGIFVSQPFTMKVDVVTGAAANTNIAIAGIKTEDILLAVIGIDGDNVTLASTVVDHGGDTSITSAGNIQSTAVTSAERLLVLWLDVNP